MQSCFRGLHERWSALNMRRRGPLLGIDAGDFTRRLFELQFADDVLLFSQQPRDLARMMDRLSEASATYGLQINLSKTKMLTSSRWVGGLKSLKVGAFEVEVLVDFAHERCLGRRRCFSGMHKAELNNRFSAGWAVFRIHKGELCNRAYPVGDRLRLFALTKPWRNNSTVHGGVCSSTSSVYTGLLKNHGSTSSGDLLRRLKI